MPLSLFGLFIALLIVEEGRPWVSFLFYSLWLANDKIFLARRQTLVR